MRTPATHAARSLALAGGVCALAACLSAAHGAEPRARFTEVTREAGIEFRHSFGDSSFSNLVEAVGGGAAWFDYDNDGNLDLYLASGSYTQGLSKGERPPQASGNRLYRNKGDGTFEDVTQRAGVTCRDCYSTAVSAADFDNDGDSDLYVANYGPNVLYRNNGNGTFSDVSRSAGVDDPRCSVGIAWTDYDRDGLLDLYVGNYIEFDPKYDLYYSPDGFPGPLNYAGQPDALYHNRGDGTFEEVGARAGLKRGGRAMAAAAIDLDGDGYDDLYVTNDAMENYLYLNQGGKKLTETALSAGVAFNGMADQTASMSVDFGDYDADGLPDIFISDNALSSLFRNEGKGRFSDHSPQAGIAEASAQFVGWGAFFFDFDNDADLDIFKTNSDLSRLFGQEDQLYENLGQGRFRDVSEDAGPYFAREEMGRGAAYADYDNDGDLDVVIVNLNSPAVLLRNDAGNARGYLQIRLEGRASNRDGIGARVEVSAGGRRQVLFKRGSGGYLSQHDPRVHVGLGDAARAEALEIHWPSGRSQVLEDVEANQILRVQEPAD